MGPSAPPELALLGLDGAGKTALFHRILGREPPSGAAQSCGYDFDFWSVRARGRCCAPKLKVKLIDLAGRREIRAYWARYYATACAACFVIRATAEARLGEARAELEAVLRAPPLRNKPLLVLVNASGDGRGQAGPETVLGWFGVRIGAGAAGLPKTGSSVEQVCPLASETVPPLRRPVSGLTTAGCGSLASSVQEPSAQDTLSPRWASPPDGARPQAGSPPRPDPGPPPALLLVASHYEFSSESFCTALVNGRSVGVSRCYLDRKDDRDLQAALQWLVRGLTAYLEDHADEMAASTATFASAVPYSNLSREEKITRLDTVRRRNDALEAEAGLPSYPEATSPAFPEASPLRIAEPGEGGFPAPREAEGEVSDSVT